MTADSNLDYGKNAFEKSNIPGNTPTPPPSSPLGGSSTIGGTSNNNLNKPQTPPPAAPAGGTGGSNNIPKKPFAEKEVSLSGMTSSVLSPKSEDERVRIEREIAKRRQKLTGEDKATSKKIYQYVGVIVLILAVIFAGYKAGPLVQKKLPVLKKIVKKVSGITFKKASQDVQNLGENKVVFERNFRLTVKSTPAVDVAVILVGKNSKKTTRETGKLLSKDNDGVKTWEFSMANLKPGNYTYKLFLKNSKTNKFSFSVSSFEIK